MGIRSEASGMEVNTSNTARVFIVICLQYKVRMGRAREMESERAEIEIAGDRAPLT